MCVLEAAKTGDTTVDSKPSTEIILSSSILNKEIIKLDFVSFENSEGVNPINAWDCIHNNIDPTG